MKILRIILLGMAAMLLSTGAGAQLRSNALVITSPASGTVVAPGQTISVSVTVNSGTYPSGIGIVGGQDGGTMLTAGPLSGSSSPTVSVTIPTDAVPGPLGLSATGADSSGNLETSAELMLDVERTDSPVGLRVDPPSFHIQQGQTLQLSVTGVYADGSWHGLTHSSSLQITSSNPAVATVQNGSVTAAGIGNANIQIAYGSLTANAPVVVSNSTVTPQQPPKVTCAASPAILWPPDGSSIPVTTSGVIAAGTSAIDPAATSFLVTDSQSGAQQSGSIVPAAEGTFTFTVPLVASRAGNIKSGRTYTITVVATDTSGHQGTCAAEVLVPHDQGQ